MIPIVEPGTSVRYTRITTCPWSSVYWKIHYVDEYGQAHQTAMLPIEANQWYYMPRWQVWREPDVVRMNTHIEVVGQNYTLESQTGRVE